jgi:hypothetical protein
VPLFVPLARLEREDFGEDFAEDFPPDFAVAVRFGVGVAVVVAAGPASLPSSDAEVPPIGTGSACNGIAAPVVASPPGGCGDAL